MDGAILRQSGEGVLTMEVAITVFVGVELIFSILAFVSHKG
jgi:hypothetical protein